MKVNDDDASLKIIISPITGGTDVIFIRRIDCATLISEYKKIFSIDVSNLMKDHQELFIYKCNESGFHFYYPFDVIGDSTFYHHLEDNDWYYMPSKWEFDEALKFIKKDSTILEIGSAKGDFLIKTSQQIQGVSCTGLELNKDAAYTAKNRGVNVLIESSTEHVNNHLLSYDVVASFQVLEHIPTPIDILKDAIKMLRTGGLLILSVPDNSVRSADSIFVKKDNILNMPPHHQGLWDIPSLTFLQKVLPIKLEYLAIEPATASHHSNSYRGLMKANLILRFGKIFGFGIYLVGRPFYDHALRHLNQYLPAHSVLTIFRKI